MNNHEYQLIGESIWDTYEDMAYIIAEGPRIEKLKKGVGAGVLALGAIAPGAHGQDAQQSQAPTSHVGGSDRPQHRVLRPTTGVSRNRMMAKRAARTTREHMRALRAQAAEGMARIQGKAQAERGVPVPPGPEPVSQASQQPHKLKQRPPFTQATGNKLTSPQGERGTGGFVNTPSVSIDTKIDRAIKPRTRNPEDIDTTKYRGRGWRVPYDPKTRWHQGPRPKGGGGTGGTKRFPESVWGAYIDLALLLERKKKQGGEDWIQKAVNPEHEGYCTPMTKIKILKMRKGEGRERH